RYHLMHAGAWLDRLARSDGEGRDRLLVALTELAPDAATVFTPLPDEQALVESGILDADAVGLEGRWRAAIAPTFARLDLLLPTFVGCPALELIKDAIARRLAAFGRPVEVIATFAVPWTSDRISPAGRAALEAAGIAPPGPTTGTALIDLEPRVPCPHCGSR